MTIPMEVKLSTMLIQIKHLMLIGEVTKPVFPERCDKLIKQLDVRAYNSRDFEDAEQKLAIFYGDLLSGKTCSKDVYCTEVLYRATSAALDFLRRCKLMESGSILNSPSRDIMEALLWDKVSCSMLECEQKWERAYKYNVFNPPALFASISPVEYARLPPKEKSTLEAGVIPIKADFIRQFRDNSFDRGKILLLSDNVVRLRSCIKVYEFMGIGWRHFYGTSPNKIPASTGLAIASDINKLISAYMEYRVFIYSECFK